MSVARHHLSFDRSVGSALVHARKQGGAMLWHRAELGWRCCPRSPSPALCLRGSFLFLLTLFPLPNPIARPPDYPPAQLSCRPTAPPTGPASPRSLPMQGVPRTRYQVGPDQRCPFLRRSSGPTTFHLRYPADQCHKGVAPGLARRTAALPRSLTRFNCVSPALTV